MSRARPSSLEYGKSEVSGADRIGAGGGGGSTTPAQARAAAAARAQAAPRGKRGVYADAVAKQTKRYVDETQQLQSPDADPTIDRNIERQRYLKGLPNRYRKGGFVDEFAQGFNMMESSRDSDDGRKKRKELFPDTPSGGGLYRKGGKVKGRSYGK